MSKVSIVESTGVKGSEATRKFTKTINELKSRILRNHRDRRKIEIFPGIQILTEILIKHRKCSPCGLQEEVDHLKHHFLVMQSMGPEHGGFFNNFRFMLYRYNRKPT